MKKSYKGPRRWAVLILVIGVTSALAFLRSPEETSRLNLEESPYRGADSLSPDLARVVSGALPSTEFSAKHGPTALPDWVTPTSQLDKLIQAGAPSASVPSAEVKLEDLNTWMGRPLNMAPVSDPTVAASTDALAYRHSPWEGSDRNLESKTMLPENEAIESAWPNQQLALQDVLRLANPRAAQPTSGPRSTVGNLIANPSSPNSARAAASATTAQAADAPTTKTQATLSSQPRQRQFVYQPGFQASGGENAQRARK